MANVTIAVVPRDRFSKAKHTLRRLLDVTPPPFRLLVVDGAVPRRYRLEMERAVAGVTNVEFLRSTESLNANAAKNAVLREVTDGEFIAFVENDNLVAPGWLERLIRACDEEGAGVARPMIFERKVFRAFPHFDQRLGRIERIATEAGEKIRFRPRNKPLSADVHAGRQRTDVLETHCLLFRRSVFQTIGFFDERINTRQEVDLALQLYTAGVPIVFEPAAQITYLRPPPVHRDERAYFYSRWDYDAALRSHQIIEEKWGLVGMPSSLDFVRRRRSYVSYSRYARHYMRHEAVPYIRYELGPNVRYALYRWASHLPPRLREPARRALYR